MLRTTKKKGSYVKLIKCYGCLPSSRCRFHSQSWKRKGAKLLPTLDRMLHTAVAVFLSTVGKSSEV